MIDLTEVFDRAETGPLMSDNDYYMKRFIPTLGELVTKYKITYDPARILNTEDDLADRVFEAAVDLLAEAGAYCPDTNRVMEFTRDEILQAVTAAPKSTLFGEGREAKRMYGRRPDEDSVPWVHVGAGIYTSSETVFMNIVEGLASISIVDSLSIPIIHYIRGRDVRVRSPQEILAAIKTVSLGQEAIRRSGRAGLPVINGISAASNAVSMIAAASTHFGLKPTDGFLVDFLSEMIVGYEALEKIAYFNSISANIGCASTPLFGGYAGGAEGIAILATCYIIMGILIFRSNYHYNAPLHSKLKLSSTGPLLWAIALSNQANGRHMRFPVVNLPYLGGGAGTQMYFYESAAYLLSVVPSGGNIFSGHPAKSVVTDSLLPMDHQFCAEIGLAAAKLTRKEAAPLVQKLYAKYENSLKNPTPGLVYGQVYDPTSGKIVNNDYLALIKEIRSELRNLGLDVRPC